MENTSQFDLNNAIRQWRENLEDLSAISAKDIDELESHLRDSTRELQASGLNLEAAFQVASQRLGPPQELAHEFEKLNPGRIWLARGLWIISGHLLFSCISWGSHIGFALAFNLVRAYSMNAHLIGILSMTASLAVKIIGILGCWWIFTRLSGRLALLIHYGLKRPLLPILGIIGLQFGYAPLGRWLSVSTAPAGLGQLPQPMVDILNFWSGCFGWVEWGLLIAALVFLLRYLGRQSPKVQGACAEFQGRGINPALKRTRIERCLWMVIGIYLFDYISVFHIILGNIAYKLSGWWPLNGHLLGLLRVGLELYALALLARFLWWFVTRHQTLSHRIGQFYLRHSFLGVVGFISIFYYGLSFGIVSLYELIPEGPGYFSENKHIVLRWDSYGYQLLHYVILVLLVFWLAHRYWKQQTAD